MTKPPSDYIDEWRDMHTLMLPSMKGSNRMNNAQKLRMDNAQMG